MQAIPVLTELDCPGQTGAVLGHGPAHTGGVKSRPNKRWRRASITSLVIAVYSLPGTLRISTDSTSRRLRFFSIASSEITNRPATRAKLKPIA